MNLRWPLVSSVVALAAGIVVAALVIAFCGENGEGPGGPAARNTPAAMGTVRAGAVTPRAGEGTPAVNSTPGGEPAETEVTVPEESPVPSAETPAEGVTPEETPTAPPLPDETPTPGPLPPTVAPIPPSPTPGPPVGLPDLVVRDVSVSRDRILVVIGNDGEGDLAAGQAVEVEVRGIVAETVVMPMALSKGASFNVLLQGQLLYERENVLGRVDPNDLIAEEDDSNNALSAELLPDVPLDLAVIALLAVGSEQHLAIHIRNRTSVPVVGADVRLTVFREGGTEAVAAAQQVLNLEPYEVTRVEVFQQVAVSGHTFRVVMEVVNLPDADPANNIFEAQVP